MLLGRLPAQCGRAALAHSSKSPRRGTGRLSTLECNPMLAVSVLDGPRHPRRSSLRLSDISQQRRSKACPHGHKEHFIGVVASTAQVQVCVVPELPDVLEECCRCLLEVGDDEMTCAQGTVECMDATPRLHMAFEVAWFSFKLLLSLLFWAAPLVCSFCGRSAW